MIDKITEAVAWFLGSWWAVIFHAIWFTVWLVFDFNLEILTLSVSLEAIFIGIFLLMAANKAEIERDLRESRQRKRDRERIEYDIKLDKRDERRSHQMSRTLEKIKQDLEKIKKILRQHSAKSTP